MPSPVILNDFRGFNMTVKVTVLSAVYGIPERILREALDCFRRQSCKDAEFLLVNDKSPDNYTCKVLEEYAAVDSRFRIVNNVENKGLAASTNIGIEQGRGKYFCRIDPDDLVPDNYLEIMTEVMDFYDADMVTCGITDFKDGEKFDFQNNISSKRYLKLKRPLKMRKMLRQKFICRMFKMETIGDLRFDERLLRGDDLMFIHLYLQRCRKCVTIDFPGYFYRHGRIFAEGEQSSAPVSMNRIPPHFYHEPRLTIGAFAQAFEQAASADERKFFSYMVMRRYMRTAFWFRRFGEKMYGELAEQLDEYFRTVVEPIAEDVHPVIAKMMRKLFCAKKIDKKFFMKLQFLRLFFELRCFGYYIVGCFRAASLKMRHIIGS